ncbi:MAG TPA: fumarylacetoacetase [Ramlibacter sp.]|jgi:fumarylacetoacetase|nr:fumarylacetoacetase [Ramlibacter sp.]
MSTDATHDPGLRSWVPGADDAATDFPIQNLPFGRFRRAGSDEAWRIGVAIGTQVLDLRQARDAAAWPHDVQPLLQPLGAGDLNAFMALGAQARVRVREVLSQALRAGSPHERELAACLVPQSQAEMTLPCHVGDYTDFYTGIHHATRVGRLFRPDNPLLPNYKWVPIGYHGRTSSLVSSGAPVRRPNGQTKAPDAQAPSFGPSKRLDYELELGFFIGSGNELGRPIAIEQAEEHLFGVTLLNDWSARDIQNWEYQPLGPFLAKNFASTVSPWVVTLEALAPFRAPLVRDAQDPQPLPYLDSPRNREQGSLDIVVEAWLQTARMREAGHAPVRLSSASSAEAAYWTPAQLVTHHASNGCNLQPGDLLGSGTLSGLRQDQAGSLLELTEGGKQPVELPGGERRTFLDDGDTLILHAYCERAGARRIGFGGCAGTILPASP